MKITWPHKVSHLDIVPWSFSPNFAQSSAHQNALLGIFVFVLQMGDSVVIGRNDVAAA